MKNVKTLNFVDGERESNLYGLPATPCCSVISLLAFSATSLVSSTFEKAFLP